MLAESYIGKISTEYEGGTVSCMIHKAIASLHEVCVQLGIRHDFMTEASAYQYVIEAERSM